MHDVHTHIEIKKYFGKGEECSYYLGLLPRDIQHIKFMTWVFSNKEIYIMIKFGNKISTSLKLS